MVVIAKEKEEENCNYELLLAWSLERAEKKENNADHIWQLASSFHQEFPYYINSRAVSSPIELLDAVGLMWETEHTVSGLGKLEKEIAKDHFVDQKGVFVKEIFQDTPNCIRSKLLALFESLSKLSGLTLTKLQKAIELQNDLQAYWRKNAGLLVDVVNCKGRLFSFFREFPDLVGFIETKFNSFFVWFCEECEKIKIYLEKDEGYWPYSGYTGILEQLLHYLELFPFQSELPFVSSKSNEVSGDAAPYLEVKKMILEIHSIISQVSYADYGTKIDLEKIQFGLNILVDNSSSVLKKRIAFEYIKCCYFLLQQESNKCQPLHSIPPLVLKVEELLNNSSFASSAEDTLILEMWVKGLGMLKGLSQRPAAGNDGYLQSLFWMIMQLLEQKEVDPLLFEYVSWSDRKDELESMIVLLKYYLPDQHSLVVKATLMFPPRGSNRLQTISHLFGRIFSSLFVPIDKFHEIPLGSFLLPVLQAFPKNLPGLLGEWLHWMDVFVEDYPVYSSFPHTSVLLNPAKGSLPHPYSEYDVVMICDRIMNSFDHHSYHSAKQELSMKIKQKTRLFLWGSFESLATTGENILNSPNCSSLPVVLLYLKFIEVNYQSPEKQMGEYRNWSN
jgi:hypothetical protein